MSQRRLILVLMAVMLFVLAACTAAPVAPAADTTAPAAGEAAAEEPAAEGDVTTITWGFWGSPEEAVSHQAVAEAFMAEHPEIQIEYWQQPWSEYHTQIVALWATGDPEAIPDVTWTAWPSPRYAVEGVLENLDPYIEASGYNLDDYWPGLLDFGMYEGSVYGLPRDIDASILYYNKDLFDAAGVAYPDDSWTWSDLEEAAAALTVKDDAGNVTQYGLAAEGGKFIKFINQTGARLLDDFTNPSAATINDPRAVEALDWVVEMLDNGYFMRPADLGTAGGDAAVFIADQAAMIIQNSSRIGAFNEAGKNYDLAPVPAAEDGTRWNSAGGASWVISAASDNKDEAWTFLSWLQSAEGGQRIYTERGEIFPALRSVAESPVFLEQDTENPLNRQAFITEAEASGQGALGFFPEWGELSDSFWTPGLNAIWAGEATPAEQLPIIEEQINTFLAENGFPR